MHLRVQRLIIAYRHPDRATGLAEARSIADTPNFHMPCPLGDLRQLSRPLSKRADDVLAYFDRPRSSNELTEAADGRLEQLRGLVLGFHNLAN